MISRGLVTSDCLDSVVLGWSQVMKYLQDGSR